MTAPIPNIPGFRIERSVEPPHPRCTTRDLAWEAIAPHGARMIVKVLSCYFPIDPAAAARWPRAVHPQRTRTLLPVFAAGMSNDGAPFFVMHPVEGETLAAKIDRGERFDRAVVKATLADLAESGSDDLQTRHILMTPKGARTWNAGVAAWRRDAEAIVAGRYTSMGQMIWHPNLTPDQAAGKKTSRPAASLALIAYAMLTGTHYWNADRDPHASPMQLLMEAMRGVGEPPSTRTDVALGPAFDRWFEQCLVGGNDDPAGTFPA